MKKSLIALAALAATGAMAQSSVTMYGNVDIGWGTATTKSADGSSVDKTTGVVDGTATANRIGFIGTEDLGGGLKAGFKLEQGISPVSTNGWNQRAGSSGHQVPNGGAFTSGSMREGKLTLSGGFGSLDIGTIQWRAGYAVASKAVVVSENFGGEHHGLVMPSRFTGVSYTTPAFMPGLTATIQHGGAHGARASRQSAADAADGFRKDENAISAINLQYTAGPLYLGAAYESSKVSRTANSNGISATVFTPATGYATNAYGAVPVNGTAGGNRTEKAYALGAQYDLGVAKLNATFANRDNGEAGAANRDSTAVSYSVSVPLGAIILAAHMVNYEVKSPTATVNDVAGHQLGARYNLSKRTFVYAHHLTDKDKALAATAQSKRTRSVLGVAHAF
jgi:predicted porin